MREIEKFLREYERHLFVIEEDFEEGMLTFAEAQACRNDVRRQYAKRLSSLIREAVEGVEVC